MQPNQKETKMGRPIEKDLDVRTFVVEHTAAQLGVSPSQITDETQVPDTMQLFHVGVVRLGMTAGVVDAQNCTVADATKAFHYYDR